MYKKRLKYILTSVLVAAGTMMMPSSCSDEVDTSDMYTFTGKTVSSYCQEDSTLSMFYAVLEKSYIKATSKSPLSVLLSTRGNYTCFIPTNDAIKHYLDSIYLGQPYEFDTISRETCSKIAMNCIIDNEDKEAYMSTDFEIGVLMTPTFSDRRIQITFDTLAGGNLAIILNSASRIIRPDIEVENGMIHVVNSVISPSVSYLPELMATAPNMRIFSRLLTETGLANKMTLYRDEAYAALTKEQKKKNWVGVSWQKNYSSPEQRYYGFTAFAEPDSIFINKWNIPAPVVAEGSDVIQNWDDIMQAVKAKCEEVYGTQDANDVTAENNAVYQFMAYHVIPYRVPWNYLVYHLTELGYYYRFPDQLTLDVWEYYVPMNKDNRMFKITHSAKNGNRYINRHCTYDNSFFGDYHEVDCDVEGVQIFADNGGYTTNALNGYYYPIGDILLYDQTVKDVVLNERMRYDVQSAMPEHMTNGIRNCSREYKSSNLYPGYVDGFTFTDETQFSYIAQGENWRNWQGDELIAYGQVDFTYRLLPVPNDGTYEVRVGCTNQAGRIMAQIYFGTNPANLSAIGLPLDFRVLSTTPSIDWVQDGTDIDENIENDKQMKNRGWMKGPQYFAGNTYTGPMTTPMRSFTGGGGWDCCGLRKVIYTGNLKAGQIYYVRMKSVLESTSNGMALDYMEVVPKWVYAGPDGEDIW